VHPTKWFKPPNKHASLEGKNKLIVDYYRHKSGSIPFAALKSNVNNDYAFRENVVVEVSQGHCVTLNAVADTGAGHSFISRNIAESLLRGGARIDPIDRVTIFTPVRVAEPIFSESAMTLMVSHMREEKTKVKMRFIILDEIDEMFIGAGDLTRVGWMDPLIAKNVADKVDTAAELSRASAVSTVLSHGEKDKFMLGIKPFIAANIGNERTISDHPDAYYDVNLKDGSPDTFFDRYTHINPSLFPEAARQIEKLLQDGVLKKLKKLKSTPRNNLPLLTVTRVTSDLEGSKTVKVRLCIDPTLVNKFIADHPFPLNTDAEQLVREAAQAKVMSVLDIKQAFHACRLSPRASDILTFKFGGDFYKYLTAPFGLKDMPQHFSRFMDKLFGHLSFVRFYIDDILILSDDIEEHSRHVKEVLQILTDNNLHISEDKCQFAVTKAKILGFIVEHGVYYADPEKVAMIKSLPRPSKVKEMQGFIGHCNYLRKHCKGEFAEYQAQLNDIVKEANARGSPTLRWTAQADKAFEALKEVMGNVFPLYVMPKDADIVIFCDASSYSWGAAIGFMEGDVFRPVDVAQGVFKDYERRYLSVKKELLAIVRSVLKFDAYVFGRQFVVKSDCKSLTYMHPGSVKDRTMDSWLAELLLYDFKLQYVQGTVQNWIADAISRHERADDGPAPIPTEIKLAALLVAESPSPFSRDLVQLLESGTEPSAASASSLASLLDIPENDLPSEEVRASLEQAAAAVAPLSQAPLPKIELPSWKRPEASPYTPEQKLFLLAVAHSATGHGSLHLMAQWLRDRGRQWSGVYQDAKEYVKNCVQCLGYNTGKKRFAFARSIDAESPLEMVQVDIHGPMDHASSKGNKYILTVVDVFTRFVVLKPLPDQSAKSVAEALLDAFSLMGFPKIIASDNGAAFVSEMMTQLKDSWHFDQRFGASYNPRAQGIVERMGGSVGALLNKLRHERYADWEALLPAVQITLNTRADAPGKMSPFEMMFSRSQAEFVDYSAAEPKFDPLDWSRRVDFVKNELLPVVLHRRRDTLAKSRARFDASHATGGDLPVGTNVMARIQRPDKGQPPWNGTFQVAGQDGAGYILKDKKGKQIKRRVPRDQLKVAGDRVASLESVDRVYAHKSPGKVHAFPDRKETLTKPLYQLVFKGDAAPSPLDWYYADDVPLSALVEYQTACNSLPHVRRDPVKEARKLGSAAFSAAASA